MAKFFIERPIFAWVLALFIIVLGSLAVTQLPIAQYPPGGTAIDCGLCCLPRRVSQDARRQRARRH